MSRARVTLFTTALLVAGVLVVLASITLGTERVSLYTAWDEWQRGADWADAPALSVLLKLRLPRTLASLLAGAGLAVAGCAFQALLRNPLATPYTLGVSSAAALGAWSAFIVADFGWLVWAEHLPMGQIFAFVFAGADVLLVWMLAARSARSSPTLLLLAGVTLGMLANSGIMFSRYIASPTRLVVMDRWLMGGVDIIGYGPVLALFFGVVPCMAVLILLAGRFDQLGFSRDLAESRGINVARLQWFTFLVGSLLTAVVVAQVGPIGFIGLVVPHAVRAFTGPGHRRLMPISMLAGGIFLCACDVAARLLLPGETPIGIVTTLIGAPFFLYLLLRRKFTDWEY